MTRYQIMRGTDWRGDATYHVYDNALRLTVAVYESRADAQRFIDNPRF
jgi:hypothetical protein